MNNYMQGLPGLPVTNSPAWAGWFNNAHTVLSDASNSGTTTERPTSKLYIGKTYFDTTLGIPIWLKTPGASPVWVNGAGSAV